MGGTRKTIRGSRRQIRGSRGQFIRINCKLGNHTTTHVPEQSILAPAAPQNQHPKLQPIFKDAATKNLQNQQNDPEIDEMHVANVLLEMKKGSSAIHNKKQEAVFCTASGTTTYAHGYHKNSIVTGDIREDNLAKVKDTSNNSQEYDEDENDETEWSKIPPKQCNVSSLTSFEFNLNHLAGIVEMQGTN
ncbi:hypothetical protein BU17DRAFT_69623 [Hysterangium stoloniferum]|nr:hypothetical protein BU17DRAFT_69623 [Hysterangium stoloniferum]